MSLEFEIIKWNFEMNSYIFGDFILMLLITLVFIGSLIFSIVKIIGLKENPYIHWFDKILIIIFYPFSIVVSFLFFIMVVGLIFYS
ncbi:hypothetical protein [Acinetobacter baumannii]|nr:hypothetical protein [Acinetobacter baumannii]MDC4372866.1 hypothetical protein [Acinetobacter baumannii]MDH2583277.1 hypothetical protein [Acinetobacter baumannii]MDO7383489.1 hypothetical protein [Acinetobacter baumannii]MEB6638194.1 hypothetical protein [Acinetobacter baumannii]OTK49814.1 hypothetical protein B9X70_10895 [Acinetobacter baumannii]